MFIRTKGFSLIELIIVIVIIGVLAVAALPRLLDTVSAAKKSAIEAVAGGFATGVTSARAQWEAQARPSITINGEKYNTVNYDGVDFWLTRAKSANGNSTGFQDGYPIAVNSDNISYPNSLTDQICIQLMENLLHNAPSVAQVSELGEEVKFSAQASDSDNSCTYTQREGNTNHKFVYQISTGKVNVTIN
ncbi:prepilin-type N-terminal cleavage/methylation domain-containing protein [Vibrio sp. S4M6]|uniref:prepilin-type N-terminal cleavage/methylation domain-containing protein n=1 Tax=Vibrio sinus TaxID=2946865 RepID=UPI00202A6754|nr:prepilin-type N-terminal cleavage/methylation domain-containing protein [Vibrio sinus]